MISLDNDAHPDMSLQTCQIYRRYFRWPEALVIRVRTTVSSVAATTASQRRKPLIVILHRP